MPEETSRQDAPKPENNDTLLLRMLYDEQARLRTEIESLRKKQQEAGDKKPSGDEGKEEKGEGGDKKEGGEDEKGGGEDKKNGEKDKDKKKPKEPLLKRIRTGAVEHPVAAVLIVVGTVLLIIIGILLWIYINSYENTDDAFIDGHTDPIRARINGYVAAIYVEDTYRVKKGQLLVELDQRDNQLSKEQAIANLSQAQAAIRAQEPNVPITAVDQSTRVTDADLSIINAKANEAAADERYKSALADLRQAEAQAANADREEERYRLLVEKEEASREKYDQQATQARVEHEVVASRERTAEAAQKAVVQAHTQVGVAESQAAQARHDLPKQVKIQRETLAQRQANALTAKAQADQAELNLQYTKIYAPEDGIVGDKQVQLASQVAPGQELFAITQTNDLWVTANFKETQIRKMHAGQGVDIYVDALSATFHGHVEALPGASGAVYSLLPPENATGNYVKVVQRLPVRIRIDAGQKDAGRLAPGMSVEPKVWLR
jgi:membrane fusion protein, multidrug efflux system